MHHGKLNLSKQHLAHVTAWPGSPAAAGMCWEQQRTQRHREMPAPSLPPPACASLDGHTFLSMILWQCHKAKCSTDHGSCWWCSWIYVSGELVGTEGQPCEWSVPALSPLNGTRNRNHHMPRRVSHLAQPQRGEDKTGFLFPPSALGPRCLSLEELSSSQDLFLAQTESRGGAERSESMHVQHYKQITKLSLHTDSRLTHVWKFPQLHSN